MAVSRETIRPIADDVFAVEISDEVDVRALLLFGVDFTLLIDTLTRPADLEEARALVEEHGRPLLIANSHADWDHWWGNAAFPDAPVIAHRLTQWRQRREGRRSLAAKQRRDRGTFAGVTLRPATVAFEGRLDLDLGGLVVELHHLPGHTHDCIVAYLPERRLLFAGDVAEDPIPLVTEGPIRPWIEGLLGWAERAKIVVPAHGAVSGPDLLRHNAAYLQSLLTEPDRRPPEEAEGDPFYRRAHRRNLKRAAEEARQSQTTISADSR